MPDEVVSLVLSPATALGASPQADEAVLDHPDDRRRALFRLVSMFGLGVESAARQLGVRVAVVEDDLRAIREETRRRIADFDALGELALSAAQFEAIGQSALLEASAARSPFAKAALLGNGLLAIQLRLKLLLATGRIPRATKRVSGSFRLSVGPDLRALSDEELEAHRKKILSEHARTDR